MAKHAHHKPQTLKIASKARERRQRCTGGEVTVRHITPKPPLTPAQLRARHLSGTYTTAVITTGGGQVFSGEFHARDLHAENCKRRPGTCAYCARLRQTA